MIFKTILGLGILFVIFAYGEQIDQAFQAILVLVGIGLIGVFFLFMKTMSMDKQEHAVRIKEGTDKIGCRAFSRRVVDSVNEKLYNVYGHDVHLAHSESNTADGKDVEVFSVGGSLMEEAFDKTDAAYQVWITMKPNIAIGAGLYIYDVSRRPGSGGLWSGSDPSVENAADKIFENLCKVLEKEKLLLAS